ncbi:MAG: YybH family protein [Leptolyngbyaceae cyanobacterium]
MNMTTTLSGAADAFYEAANQMLAGDLSAFEAIWSEADDITHLGPTGSIYTGRAAVMEQFAREAAMGFEGTLRAEDRQYVETAEMGYLVCVERTSGMTKAGHAITVDIRATTIFRKEAGQWRVVHNHTDRF